MNVGAPRLNLVVTVVCCLLVAATGVSAEPAQKVHRIGFLRASPPPARLLAAFREGLSREGYKEGRNYVLVKGWGDGALDERWCAPKSMSS